MIVGIDLGTTNSLVAVLRDGEPVTLPNELGDHLTPSVVAVAEDGALLVGRPAKDRLVVAPDAGAAFFKRDMGTDKRYSFGKRKWSPVELSAAVLGELKRTAERHLGSDGGSDAVTAAVISVPAYFHDTQRQATIAAAEIAGLEVARILNEPTAAALAYGYRHPDRESHLMVFDLGGGTFDITILHVFEGIVEVLASAGDSMLGGEDYTDALLDLLLARSGKAPGPPERARLRQELEVVKRALARAATPQTLQVDDIAVPVSRDDLRDAGRDLTARLRPILTRCLRDAGLDPSDLRECLLVGGATRMHLVDDLLQSTLRVRANRAVDPDRAVALGAAVQAAAIEKNEAVRDIILTDVCPHTLGTEIAKEFRPGQHEPGFFEPILDRNVTIPASRAVTLHTLHPRQDSVDIAIFQGENRLVKDNTFLGELRVKGLRHKPGQQRPGEFEVRYSYDMNGVLEVEVTVLETGAKHVKVIESRPGELTKKEVEAAVRRLQTLKVNARDLLPNRARLQRAERLFAELAGAARDTLTILLDGFEHALHSEDPEQVQIRGAALDDFLRPYYQEEGEPR